MKKLILRYINSSAGKISFKVEEQTHRNSAFANGDSDFRAKNDIVIYSDGYPAMYDYDYDPLTLYCRGIENGYDDNIVTTTKLIWEKIKVAVKEYNEHYGYYGECILGDPDNVIKNIIPMEMFIID